MKPIPYGRQFIDKADEDAVIDALRSDFMTQGPRIAEFEEKFADYVGAKYAVAVSNGTAALHLSAMAIDIQPGDKIITTPITFAASANCVKYCGGEVVFCDIDPTTFLLSIEKLVNILESSPRGTYKAVIPVDFAGFPCDMEAIKKLAEEYNFKIIEDACHAPGGFFIDSRNEKQMCGSGNYSDLTVFSFHPVKHIACGEGGMITTNDENLYKKLMSLRTHGITKDPSLLNENHGGWYYEMQELGYNYRLTDMQAALGISQLTKLEWSVKRRTEIAERYDKAFAGTLIKTPGREGNIHHAFHLYVIQVEDRIELYNHLKENKIFAQVHYVPVHKMPYYWTLKEYSLPISETYYSKCLSLPMFPSLTNIEQDYIIEVILKYYEK